MSSPGCATTVVAQLAAQGVTDVVLAPGSRSAPLALALHAADAAGRLRLHVRVDERSAGFHALGLARGSGCPAAVVTTSGTAVGNLLPAVMEASHAGVPLVVVTADRPTEIVGSGANQTTDQQRIFGGFTRYRAQVDARAAAGSWAADTARAVLAAAGASGAAPGPVHLNLALPEPLVAATPPAWPAALPVRQLPPVAVVEELAAGPRTVVVCGDATPAVGAAARTFAAAAAAPLLAEPTSNARSGPEALRCGRLLLAGDLAERIERVVVFGHPTLSRPVAALLARDDLDLVVVGTGEWPDPGRRATRLVRAATLARQPAEWLAAWQQADAACGARLDALLAGLDHPTGLALAAAVEAAVGPGALVLGNSQAVRDADLAPVAAETGPRLGNRGLAGIDGTLATAAGIALGLGQPVTLLCGDLTFVHDSGALAIGPGEPRPDLRVVVADDGGGSIFATLEYGAPEFAGPFERVFATPSGVDPVALAAGYGVPARRIALAEVTAALAAPPSGVEVLVVGIDRERRRALEADVRALVTADRPRL
jgi:2-succinyl-5-enolpyruvyl-6-hydroxy-3-cyclohexene-1-carboxylate synthase